MLALSLAAVGVSGVGGFEIHARIRAPLRRTGAGQRSASRRWRSSARSADAAGRADAVGERKSEEA